MINGSWFKVHGSGLMATDGSWFMVKGTINITQNNCVGK
jgi:hypothetical protein